MAITLSDGATTLALPDDLLWSDRHTWSPVEQAVATSITGAAIIDTGARTAGRPITLAGDERHAWMPYSTVQQLKAWAAVPDKQLSLSIAGAVFSVVFRHHEAPALDLQPLLDYADPLAPDFFFGSIKLMEV